MLHILAICLGGGIGAVLRYLLFLAVQRPSGPNFPTGTLVINLLGCLAIGFLWTLFEGTRLTPGWRLFLFTGVLGGFTTFSAFGFETLQLWEVGEWRNALLYVALSNGVGLSLVAAGALLARRVHWFAG
ncbi:MAG: fluoride efflux transporter CrcB [Thermodesulfobacteriota bacterium]